MTIDVIIPTYNPDENLTLLLGNLQRQSLLPNKIYILNTLIENSNPEDFNAQYKISENIEIRHIESKDFDHGTTRNYGASLSDADCILFITQDAIPADNKMLENLANDLNENVVLAYGRQIGSSNLPIEKLSRSFNYPNISYVKSEKDKERLGIKVCFCSNVCALYNRKIFNELNGFPNNNIFNEDMLYAYKVISSGYSIAYVADAKVLHTHNYSLKKNFARYFDQGVSQKQNEEIFDKFSSVNEGKKQASYIIKGLIQENYYFDVIIFFFQSIAKLSGFFIGKHYKLLPISIRKAFSMNKKYWERKTI